MCGHHLATVRLTCDDLNAVVWCMCLQVVNDQAAAIRMQQAASDIEESSVRDQANRDSDVQVFSSCSPLDASREDVSAWPRCRSPSRSSALSRLLVVVELV